MIAATRGYKLISQDNENHKKAGSTGQENTGIK